MLETNSLLPFFTDFFIIKKKGKEVLAHSPAPGRVGYLVLRSLLPLVRDAAKYDPDRHTPPVGVAFLPNKSLQQTQSTLKP